MQLRLIQVPYMAGDDRAGSARGPARCIQAGAEKRLRAAGHGVRLARVERGAPFRDSVSSSLAVCKQVAVDVKEAVEAGDLPIVLAGGCDVSKGVLSGMEHGSTGILWFDAHGDFNTPESTITGYFPGMSLSVITGHCYRRAWEQLGNARPVPEGNVVMVGVRELDPAERERLQRSAIQVVYWNDGEPQGSVDACLDRLAERGREIYLHIDMDALDPEVAPGVVDRPVPGGLTVEQMEQAISAATMRFRIKAVTLATYNPDGDRDDRTLHTALRLLEGLGRGLS
jgi:arginase